MSRETIENPKLTALVGAELKALPLRRAPAALQLRVLAELARREALPWWRHSFRDWPLAAQLSFALLALAVTHLVIWAFAGQALSSAGAWIEAAMLAIAHGVHTLGNGLHVLRHVLGDLAEALPAHLLLLGSTAIAGAYVLLLTGGTLVYRSLQENP